MTDDNTQFSDDLVASQECGSDILCSQNEEMTQQSPRDDDGEIRVGEYDHNREFKDWLVARLLCRWWYALPDWPPANYSYYDALERHKLRVYDIEEFEDHENVDTAGYSKAYQCSAFPVKAQYLGVFRDYAGKAYDLRPSDGKPCYNNFVKFTNAKLFQLVETAIRKQLEVLEKSKYDETITINLLKEELVKLLSIKEEQNQLQTEAIA